MTRLILLTGVVFSAPAAADGPDVKLDGPTREAVGRGLAWLKEKQNADGSWSERRYPHNTAITSFALLAYMSQGNTPTAGKYAPQVAKAAQFLVASARPADGYLVGPRGGNMYSHGMATLALSQVYGTAGDPEVRKALSRATRLIVGSQGREGGWRYQPNDRGADISVTIMQVMALRGAKNAGLHVPRPVFERALAYINRCHDGKTGGFCYQPGTRRPGYARTAAGVCVLKLAGEYGKDDIVKPAVAYMAEHRDDRKHYWYGQYYASHAMHQVGGEAWKKHYGWIKSRLLGEQKKDGSWSARGGGGSPGPVYQTAIGVIILSVPTHYLPIFQR